MRPCILYTNVFTFSYTIYIAMWRAVIEQASHRSLQNGDRRGVLCGKKIRDFLTGLLVNIHSLLISENLQSIYYQGYGLKLMELYRWTTRWT